ncbi:hypothetical protein B0H13DRAFT_2065335, partial [Mycena leptocephala]
WPLSAVAGSLGSYGVLALDTLHCKRGLLPGLESACSSPLLKLLSPPSFPRLRMSRAPLSVDGDSLAGLLDGAVSDQAPDAVASVGLGASESDARGIRAGGGNMHASWRLET